MNILLSTILYMVLSIIFVVLADYTLHRKDFRDYQLLTDKHRFIFMLTVLSILYLIYTVTYSDKFLPMIIIGVCLSIIWIWFFIMDTDLNLLQWWEKIILLSITVIAFISIYFSFEYLLSLGVIKLVRIDLNDFEEGCYDCETPNTDQIFIRTDKPIKEVRNIVTQHIRKFRDENLDYDDTMKNIANSLGGEVPSKQVYEVIDFNIHSD